MSIFSNSLCLLLNKTYLEQSCWRQAWQKTCQQVTIGFKLALVLIGWKSGAISFVCLFVCYFTQLYNVLSVVLRTSTNVEITSDAWLKTALRIYQNSSDAPVSSHDIIASFWTFAVHKINRNKSKFCSFLFIAQ